MADAVTSEFARVPRILFFAEAVTLAHVARPIALARSLDAMHYETVMACHPAYHRFFASEKWRALPLQSIDSRQFLDRLAHGRSVYDAETLHRYVRDDLALIESVQPDMIVGDFRLSLSVSARLARIPYVGITNAYWSPHQARWDVEVPALPLSRMLPLPIADQLFAMARPIAFAMHCRPLNRVRKDHGLASLGNDLRRAYTDADHVLYADAPTLFPTTKLPDTHRFIGPVLWSPQVESPEWWDRIPSDKPIIYLTLGSSGHARSMEMVLDALATLPVTVIASSAGATAAPRAAGNAHVADYLPGDAAAARSSLVICNGGSPTSHQAISAGVPVLGIASNLDQFLNMAALRRAGAGELLRSDRLSIQAIRAAVSRMLASRELRAAACRLGAEFANHSAVLNFGSALGHILQGPRVGWKLPHPPGGHVSSAQR